MSTDKNKLEQAKALLEQTIPLVEQAELLFREAYDETEVFDLEVTYPAMQISGEEIYADLGEDRFSEIVDENKWISSSSTCW